MQRTRSLTLQLKKPARIICEVSDDNWRDQCENVLVRACFKALTSTETVCDWSEERGWLHCSCVSRDFLFVICALSVINELFLFSILFWSMKSLSVTFWSFRLIIGCNFARIVWRWVTKSILWHGLLYTYGFGVEFVLLVDLLEISGLSNNISLPWILASNNNMHTMVVDYDVYTEYSGCFFFIVPFIVATLEKTVNGKIDKKTNSLFWWCGVLLFGLEKKPSNFLLLPFSCVRIWLIYFTVRILPIGYNLHIPCLGFTSITQRW